MGADSHDNIARCKYLCENNYDGIIHIKSAFCTPEIGAMGIINKICKEHDVTLSLGDGLRPGCIHDATDIAQIRELTTLGRLVKRSQKAGVQVMVEGPGHVPITQVKANMQIQKTICSAK